jgi:transcriptional regulator with XRE-family HTH domain
MLYFEACIAKQLNGGLMSRHIKALINQLVSTAKARGLSQAQLADMAGLTAVGLSKAKSRGDIRASTLEELGTQLGLELAFIPTRSREKAAEAIKSGTFFRTSDDSENEEK